VKSGSDIETKLGAARTRLILEKPFIGALVMHLPLVRGDPAWCETVATDARAFYYNPRYVARLTLAETQFVLAHEAMHCALGHFARRGHRTRRRWDVACDYAVNLMLAEEGLKPPPGALLAHEFRGLAAEEIYPLIVPDTVEQTLDRHLYDEAREGAHGAPVAGGPAGEREHAPGALQPVGEIGTEEAERLARQWQGRMVSAAQQAHRAGRLPGSWLRLVGHLISPQLPWRALLARYMVSAAREDYSFERLSRREGDALLPRLASSQAEVHVVLDTSGSIGEEELAQFAAEVDALKGEVRARVTLHACDERLDPGGPWVYEPWEQIDLPRGLGGGGGTRFGPVFEWMDAMKLTPDLLLYFTDAEGDFPGSAPAYPVVWLVKGRAQVPWGERIQLN
jgi:predicted metal-dependent peptidase